MFGLDAPGAVSVFVFIFGLLAAVLAFLMPFFVFRIRNEMISLNRKVERLVVAVEATTMQPAVSNVCPDCGLENKDDDSVCRGCGMPL